MRRDGAIRAQAGGGQPVILPADYTAQHVELGYAVTAHRCQGVTVDTTHTLATSRMTREAFYVAMTRGRVGSRAYIDTDTCHGELDNLDSQHETRPARSILEQVLANQGAEPSAHTLRDRLIHRRAAVRSSERRLAGQSQQSAGMSR